MTTTCTPNGACAPTTTEPRETTRYARPRVELRETADAAILLVDLPGVRPEDVALTAENGELTLVATTSLGRPEGRVLLSEWTPANYRRVFRLGEQADAENVEARLEHGVLRVRVPKAAHAQPRRVPVTIG